MAKAKTELLKEAQNAGLVPEDVSADDYTAAQLEALLSSDVAAWEGSASATTPQVAPDGHVNLSQEDIDARQ